MTDREAMKQALEALEWWEDDFGSSKEPSPVIIALRSRLAQPEQEPVQFKCTVIDDAHPNGVPLEQWVKPPQRKPLTVEEIEAGRRAPWGVNLDAFTAGVRFAEAEHGIKGEA